MEVNYADKTKSKKSLIIANYQCYNTQPVSYKDAKLVLLANLKVFGEYLTNESGTTFGEILSTTI
jgi:hypothetical protein